MDVDYDGVPDLVYRDGAGTAHKAYLGSGAAWVRSNTASSEVIPALLGAVKAEGTLAEYADRADYRHRYTHRAADVNGDGLTDLVDDVNDDGVATVRYARPILDQSSQRAAPARLMRTVDNGHGGKTTVTYGRSTTAGKWVVAELAADPGHGEPVITTKYIYKFSTFLPGPFGQRGFRGFREHRALNLGDPNTGTDDRTAVTVYDYSQDQAGLPVESYTVLGDSAFYSASGFDRVNQSGVMSVTKSSYHVKELPVRNSLWVSEHPSRIVLPKTSNSYTCTGTNGQTAAGCEAAGTKSTSITTFSSHSAGSAYVLEKPESTEVRFVNGDGDLEVRKSTNLFNVRWTASVFNTAPASSTGSVTIGNTTTDLARTTYAYHDADFRYLMNTTVTDLKANPAPPRTTRMQYFGGTGANRGLLYRTWAPEQVNQFGNLNSADGFTEYAYDVHGVTATRTLTPRRAVTGLTEHIVTETTVDRATGVVLESRGPDYVCADDTNGTDTGTEPDPWYECEFGNALHKARVVNKVDGLGRVRSVVKHPASAAAGVEVARAAYNDNVAFDSGGTTPVSTVNEAAVGDGKFSHTTTEVDGLGRAIRTMVKQDNLADQVVTYDYDHSGNTRDVYTARPDGAGGTIGLRTNHDPLGSPPRPWKSAPPRQATTARCCPPPTTG
ncbi:hypothetical protein ACTG9Q_15865 [Actinokineospora sp. 24-640]